MKGRCRHNQLNKITQISLNKSLPPQKLMIIQFPEFWFPKWFRLSTINTEDKLKRILFPISLGGLFQINGNNGRLGIIKRRYFEYETN